jgi:hypothetical protein
LYGELLVIVSRRGCGTERWISTVDIDGGFEVKKTYEVEDREWRMGLEVEQVWLGWLIAS